MDKTKKRYTYNNVGRANIFSNKFKKSDKEPDLKGDGEIMGNKVSIAGWFKEDKNSKRFLSLSFDDMVEAKTPAYKKNTNNKGLDDWFDGDSKTSKGKQAPWEK